ncbi:maleylpyruvate isomerase family mycothiol-dependent enzyme [Streptomyces canus]|uniref:maleylpyruvate isomerase family mycothiol-dependent enzyme n=1 Tax=Streptomyces canus TaxID=58343 RepID=UPI003696132A
MPTRVCPGWSVRDVMAHCSSALTRVVEGRFEKGVFSPESNDRDIAERADWSNQQVVDELERGMTEAGPVIAGAGGGLDFIGLGVGVPHAFEAVGEGARRGRTGRPRGAGAYAGPGLPDALALPARTTRERGHLPLHADVGDLDEPVRLGDVAGDRTPARYIGDAATLVRLYAGRPVEGRAYALAGAEAEEWNIFG